MTSLPLSPADLAVAVAAAAVAALPSVEPLTPGPPRAGHVGDLDGFAGAAIASLEGPMMGRIGVLVGPQLVAALTTSPLGDLDLAAVTQPAIDAMAIALGAAAKIAATLPLGRVITELNGPFMLVPLVGTGISAAVVISDVALAIADVPHDIAPAGAGSFLPGAGVLDVGGTAVPAADSPDVLARPAEPVSVDATPTRGIEMLHGVIMDVTVELGRTRMSVRDLLALSPGTVLELDRAAGSPADLLVNGRLIARGEVVVIDEDFGLRVTEILEDATAG